MNTVKKVLYALSTTLLLYFLWSFANNQPEVDKATSLHLREISEIGEDTGNGNIVGIQPYMLSRDYASLEHFYNKIDLYFQRANQENLFQEKTVVLLPEHIGTWLVALDESPEVYRQEKWDLAVREMASQHASDALTFNFTGHYQKGNFLTEQVFAAKSPWMAQIYDYVFSSLAKKYSVTIIAGSILLSQPAIQGNKLVAGSKRKFYNTTVVYTPDGVPHINLLKKPTPEITKAYLQGTESGSGTWEGTSVFDLPIGRTCVLLDGEETDRSSCKYLVGQSKVDCVAIPSFKDKKLLSDEGSEAWMQEVVQHSIQKTGFHVYLRGQLWDIDPDGCSTVVKKGKVTQGFKVDGSSIISLWL